MMAEKEPCDKITFLHVLANWIVFTSLYFINDAFRYVLNKVFIISWFGASVDMYRLSNLFMLIAFL